MQRVIKFNYFGSNMYNVLCMRYLRENGKFQMTCWTVHRIFNSKMTTKIFKEEQGRTGYVVLNGFDR